MSQNWIEQLVRDNIRGMTPYQSARKLGGDGNIWLNANELPDSIARTNVNRYPEPQPTLIKQQYSSYAGVKDTQVLVTRGADEGIELIIRTFCEPQKQAILVCPPTYGMYTITANTQNVTIIEVPLLKESFQLDLETMKQALLRGNCSLVFICNPNNPTGTSVPLEDIETIISVAKGRSIVVIDEAYIEFSEQNSTLKLFKNHEHVVILRTLSKAFGLAGVRCGFILAHEAIILALSKIIAPYPIPKPVVDIVTRFLEEDSISIMKSNVSLMNSLKKEFIDRLQKLSIVETVYLSETNYLLVRFKKNIFKELWDNGIILRDQSYHDSLKYCVRITIGDQYENDQVLKQLIKIEREQ